MYDFALRQVPLMFHICMWRPLVLRSSTSGAAQPLEQCQVSQGNGAGVCQEEEPGPVGHARKYKPVSFVLVGA